MVTKSLGSAVEKAPPGKTLRIQAISSGKLLIAGRFTSINGLPRKTFARLNANGSVDTSFGSNLSIDGSISEIVALSDGRVLLRGDFNSIGNVHSSGAALLSSNGEVNPAFAVTLAASAPTTLTALSAGASGAFSLPATLKRQPRSTELRDAGTSVAKYTALVKKGFAPADFSNPAQRNPDGEEVRSAMV